MKTTKKTSKKNNAGRKSLYKKPMPRVNVSIPDEVRESLESLANGKGLSEGIRRAERLAILALQYAAGNKNTAFGSEVDLIFSGK